MLVRILILVVGAFCGLRDATAASDCGTTGDVNTRGADCGTLTGSSKTTSKGVTWMLISRKMDPQNGVTYEIWRDGQTGLVWGDRIPIGDQPYASVVKLDESSTACKDVLVYMGGSTYSKNCPIISELACASEENGRATAGITDRAFGLPTVQEYGQAERDGMREVVPHLTYFTFWTISLDPSYPKTGAYTFDGDFGTTQMYERKYSFSARCIGR